MPCQTQSIAAWTVTRHPADSIVPSCFQIDRLAASAFCGSGLASLASLLSFTSRWKDRCVPRSLSRHRANGQRSINGAGTPDLSKRLFA